MLPIRSPNQEDKGLLNWGTKGIGNEKLGALAYVLESIPSVTVFDLSENRIDDKSDSKKKSSLVISLVRWQREQSCAK